MTETPTINTAPARVRRGAPLPEDVLALWQEAFGDAEDTVRAFLEALPADALCIRAEAEGTLCGMVFAVPIAYRENEKITARGNYLHAACVKKSERGKGIFRLLDGAVRALGADFDLLIPAGDGLFSLYRHLGYTTVAGCHLPEADEHALGETAPFDGDIDRLYTLELHCGSAFLKPPCFFAGAVRDFLTVGEIRYLTEAGVPVGYAAVRPLGNGRMKLEALACPIRRAAMLGDMPLTPPKALARGMDVRGDVHLFFELE